ncbi:peptide deformylase-like protein [Brucella abortus 01-4165]|nr:MULTISPECIES: peptide deformylase [Brucella]ENT41747.1 peptide deformylase-like protein [Brucella suis F5/05-10]EPF76779.1 peptide deformylase-like protein [Brucella abortus B10-0973]EPF82901.1 peptide deformylase-like protein [Brucella abortus B10-0018]EPF88800.1 peptide deformylase-like protein [Brucella abortus 01-0648]EPF90179.1 peptide deformylase-like protein [Brucella abortus 94-1313]EPF94117.1 peptide deformylase-like protein [Brucella abortus 90-1280]EPF98216.1 peptide deformylas
MQPDWHSKFFCLKHNLAILVSYQSAYAPGDMDGSICYRRNENYDACQRDKMTVRLIVKYPDPRLRAAAEPVTTFDEGLRKLADDLLDTMRAAPGIGITAPHIGISKRVVVLELDRAAGPKIYINPEIVWACEEKIRHQEGSVSMPGVVDEVERHARIRLRYQDLDGNEQTEESDGLLAVCHQHEIDQLDGIFWVQRLSRLRRERLIKRYEKLQR